MVVVAAHVILVSAQVFWVLTLGLRTSDFGSGTLSILPGLSFFCFAQIGPWTQVYFEK